MHDQFVYDMSFDNILDGDKVVIYGAGKFGHYVAKRIVANRKVQIVAFIDKNFMSKCEFIKNIPIVSPESLMEYKDCKYIIAIWDEKMALEVKAELIRKGIEGDRIIVGDYEFLWNDDAVVDLIKYIRRLAEKNNNSIYMFMLPEHGNTGDYLIGCSEKLFFKKYFPKSEYYEVTSAEWLKLRCLFKKIIRPSDIICISGGGFFGDLRGDDVIYRDIIESFPDNCKIFMPNTLTYRKAAECGNDNFKSDILWLKKQRRLHIFFRDRHSHEIVKQLYDDSYFAPDMALFWKVEKKEVINKSDKVLLCFRNDCEILSDVKEHVQNILSSEFIEYDCFDIYLDEYIDQEDGQELLQYIFNKFSTYNCVITDRLHAMLISTILNVPCIAFDNLTGKIRGVYEWIEKYEYIKVISGDNVNDIGMYINEVCHSDLTKEYIPPYDEFDKMAHMIMTIIENERIDK